MIAMPRPSSSSSSSPFLYDSVGGFTESYLFRAGRGGVEAIFYDDAERGASVHCLIRLPDLVASRNRGRSTLSPRYVYSKGYTPLRSTWFVVIEDAERLLLYDASDPNTFKMRTELPSYIADSLNLAPRECAVISSA